MALILSHPEMNRGNLRYPDTYSLGHLPDGHLPDWTLTRLQIYPTRHLPDWTFTRLPK